VAAQRGGVHHWRGRRGIGLVAHVVVAGHHVEAVDAAGAQLGLRFVHGALEVGAAGEGLGQVAEVEDKGRLQSGDAAQGCGGARGLVPARLELEGPVARIEHVVRVRDDAELEKAGRQQGAVEACWQGGGRRR